MSREAVGQLIDQWLSNPEFRKKIRQDHEGAIKESGVTLSQEELAAFRKIDWNLSDEELRSRTSNAVV